MLGFLAATLTCPRCHQNMSEIDGSPHSRRCTSCVQAYRLQVGYLVAEVDSRALVAGPADIDLTQTIDLTVVSEPVA